MESATSWISVSIAEGFLSGKGSVFVAEQFARTFTRSPPQRNWQSDDLSADQISARSDIVLHPRCGETISVIVSKQKYHDPLRVIETVCLTIFVDVLHLFAGNKAFRAFKSALLLNRPVATNRQSSPLIPIYALLRASKRTILNEASLYVRDLLSPSAFRCSYL